MERKEIREILSAVDHTLLRPDAAWEEIRTLCDEGIRFGCASVCIPPSYVRQAAQYIAGAGSALPVCTVLGFPNGYSVTAAKQREAECAAEAGAEELDMVINLGWVKDARYDLVLEEINRVRESGRGRLLKVIIETCLLTEDEKRTLCEVVSNSEADFIKTSTGFAGGGATREDVALMARHMTNGKKIKAAGGIAGLRDAADFLALGASRLGTSRLVKAARDAGYE